MVNDGEHIRCAFAFRQSIICPGAIPQRLRACRDWEYAIDGPIFFE
jgi:hypothetical protein